MILSGYAAPFAQTAWLEDGAEYIAHGAFDGMLAAGVFLNVRDHDAPRIADDLTLFCDSYGLGFRANVPDEVWSDMKGFVCRKGGVGASIDMAEFERVPSYINGHSAGAVVRATIDHICISDTPAYSGTGVWPSVINGPVPARIEALRERFNKSWIAHVAARARESRVPKEAKVAAFLAPRQNEFAATRRLLSAQIRSSRMQSGVIFAHAAFTRAAGFNPSGPER